VIVRSTINLGHALGLKVVAEGVEIAASFDALLRYGCDSVQGYFVSKPMPPTEFMRWVHELKSSRDQAFLPRSSYQPVRDQFEGGSATWETRVHAPTRIAPKL
jgi:predicted signal transduction protein with EAL and GGDEF domain